MENNRAAMRVSWTPRLLVHIIGQVASTDVGGTVNKYEYTVSKQEPHYFPVLSNKQVAIGLVSQEWKKAGAT